MARARRTILFELAIAPWVLSLALASAFGCQAQADEEPTRPASEAPLSTAIRVETAVVNREALEFDTSVTGTVHAFKSSTIAAEVPGRITHRTVELGAEVENGAGLFRLDTQTSRLSLRQSQTSEASAQIDLDLAERELKRAETLLATGDISRSHFEQLEHQRDMAAKRLEQARISRQVAAATLRDGRVRAPFDGTVVRLHAEVGDYVAPGTPLASLADLSRMRFRVGLTASEAIAFEHRPDQQATVRFDALGGRPIEARLHDVASLVDPASGTYTAEFWLDQPEGSPLRQGMVGQLELVQEERSASLSIPRAALVRAEGGFAVWTVEAKDEQFVARLRTIAPGRQTTDRVEVLEGLAQGEMVIVRGQFALREGALVEIDGARE